MIVVDTNVWSEPFRPAPDARVVEWLRVNHGELRMTALVEAELLTGVALLPDGRRKDQLRMPVERLLARAAETSLPFGSAAARELAAIRARRRAVGREIRKPTDAMIAAIARAHGASVATRNVDDFADMGVDLINPWEWEPPVTSPV